MSEPKPDSPEYYWLCHVLELQELLSPGTEEYNTVYSLLFAHDMELLEVADFCSIEPGNPSDLTVGDLTSGGHIAKYVQAARQAAFYKLCQDS